MRETNLGGGEEDGEEEGRLTLAGPAEGELVDDVHLAGEGHPLGRDLPLFKRELTEKKREMKAGQ